MAKFPPPRAGLGIIEGVKDACNKAFTLAEVLITLVIIGIVAALTIPAISRSSEKYILKNQFKKTYSTIVNAMNKADADLGGNTQCYYPEKEKISNSVITECNAFYSQFFANLSITKVCKGEAQANGCIPTPYIKNYTTGFGMTRFNQSNIENNAWVYDLADGTIIMLYCSNPSAFPLFMADINGAKGPNEIGKDVFMFVINRIGDNGLKFMNKIIFDDTQSPYFRSISDIYKDSP